MRERPIVFSGEMVRAILDGRKTMTRRVLKPQPICWPSESGHCLGVDVWQWEPPGDREYVWHETPSGGWNPGAIAACRCPYGQPGDLLWVRETRILLEVTDVRVERLTRLTDEDAVAEGVIPDERLPSSVIFAGLWDRSNAKRGYPWDSNPWVWVILFKRIEGMDTCSREGVAEPNARRIVACVNACEGISTQWLETYGQDGGLTKGREACARYRDALDGVRDELKEGQPPNLNNILSLVEKALG